MRYIIVDLEATCWENVRDSQRMEITEIGAVELATAEGPATREFGRFVRPTAEPLLSNFCRRLTTIQQVDVDAADDFATVFAEFVAWIGPTPFVLGSWGGYDLSQFRTDCRRHRLALPVSFERHLNLKTEYATAHGIRPCGMNRALSHAGLSLIGTHHRGIDDARNIARLAMRVLPMWESAATSGC